jgi:hypothetical protein
MCFHFLSLLCLSADLFSSSHSIWDKLTELGYGDVVEAVEAKGRLFGKQPFTVIPTFTASRKLTAGGMTHLSVIVRLCIDINIEWDKISKETIAIMDEQREYILTKTKRKVLEPRFKACQEAIEEYVEARPFTQPGPGVADIALFPPVRDLLRMTSVDSLKSVTKKSFVDALKKVGKYEEEWMKERQEELVQMLRHGGNPKATVEDLPLVTTLFRCDCCCWDLSYPRVIVHNCLSEFSGGEDGDYHDRDTFGPIVFSYFDWCGKTWPWDANEKISAIPLPETWKELLKFCGVNGKPFTRTTWEECLWQPGRKIEEMMFRIKPIKPGWGLKSESVAGLAYLVSTFDFLFLSLDYLT